MSQKDESLNTDFLENVTADIYLAFQTSSLLPPTHSFIHWASASPPNTTTSHRLWTLHLSQPQPHRVAHGSDSALHNGT